MKFFERRIPGRAQAIAEEIAISEAVQPAQPIYVWKDERSEEEEEQLRLAALNHSYASTLIGELNGHPQVEVENPDSWYPNVYIHDERFPDDVHYRIGFVGRLDGGVTIGHIDLNRRQAIDPQLVTNAFNQARETAEPIFGKLRLDANR